ncbi:MAG: S9 family peptidase [Acidobacteria bacterium]|nr:S9 family peptidase [Acidobacteriota bacterium]
MMRRRLAWMTAAAVVAGAVVWTSASNVVAQAGAQADIRAEYDRATSLRERTQGLAIDVAETPVWLEGTSKFWYRKSVAGGSSFVLVDAAAATKAPAFDHARLAAALSAAANGKYTAVTLPFNTFRYVENQQGIELAIGLGAAATRWRCTLATYDCTRVTGAAAGGGQGRGGGGGRAGGAGQGPGGAAEPQVRRAPDESAEAVIRNFNVHVRPLPEGDFAALSTDGSEGNGYTFQSLRWSPDSKKLVAFRRRPGFNRQVHYVESSPADQVQPKHSSIVYRKPGDEVDFDHPVVFDVATKQRFDGDTALYPNPFANSRLAWREDSRAVTFEFNQRGHQVYRVLELDATTGRTRTVIEETSKTFVEYSGKRIREDVLDGREIVWASERDGWNHLYLYDGATGQVKNQITKGAWAVRGVQHVDATARQIWFSASGMHAPQDPYFVHFYRINFDGTGLTPLTPADGTHAVTWSSDRQFYVDSWSRVDQAPIAELRRTSDQSLVMPLEKGDMTALLKTGWRPPETFVSKARDGKTDIWGVIIRPTNFDPAKTYPVIENIYAGPQGSFVPKTFSTQLGMQAQAELGFIVVQIDGMGTSNRSKAFHDVAWKNLGDAGFPDRILWHKAVAAKYPYYDITRVGIYGTSAGGQNAGGALLFHPDFYDVAVSAVGCHDNRMDKIWWNEQWMGWPIGPEYAASSNVDHAKNLQGRLLLVVGEMDSNVDPASTMQVVNALIKANKVFDLLVIPGANHGPGGAYGERKRFDFFVKHLRGVDPPNWNTPAAASAADLPFDDVTPAWVASEEWGR